MGNCHGGTTCRAIPGYVHARIDQRVDPAGPRARPLGSQLPACVPRPDRELLNVAGGIAVAQAIIGLVAGDRCQDEPSLSGQRIGYCDGGGHRGER